MKATNFSFLVRHVLLRISQAYFSIKRTKADVKATACIGAPQCRKGQCSIEQIESNKRKKDRVNPIRTKTTHPHITSDCFTLKKSLSAPMKCVLLQQCSSSEAIGGTASTTWTVELIS